MPVVAVMGGAFCHADEISRQVAEGLGTEFIGDDYLIDLAVKELAASESGLRRTLSGKVSAFNKFTHERERSVAWLKMATARVLGGENLVVRGLTALLIPREITHVLKVCLIADLEYRVRRVMAERGLNHKEATAMIRREDEAVALFTGLILDRSPWTPDLYDLLIPMDKSSPDLAVELILENARKPVLIPTEASRMAVADFKLASQVEGLLATKGHNVSVAAAAGRITLTINRHVIMLGRLEAELKRLAGGVPGVKEVETKVGPDFHQADIVYSQLDLDTPSRVLLVDDEREFVQTLSERLLMRDVGSTVVYDGEQALSFVKDEEPDVIVLDLKMPGIDGIEVLRRIKKDHPGIEVIILTGHGTKSDEQLCRELGAFAYLQKPVEIDVLSRTMREAYRHLRTRRGELEE